jgi:sulfoxide reductase catalytic subunit YedY
MKPIDRSEITPEHLYLSRRKFIKGLGLAAAGAAAAACAGPAATPTAPTATPVTERAATVQPPVEAPTALPLPTLSASADEMGNELTSLPAINSYNNYYEFTFSKEGVGALTSNFQTSPWTVEVGGLVERPKTYDMQELRGRLVYGHSLDRLSAGRATGPGRANARGQVRSL